MRVPLPALAIILTSGAVSAQPSDLAARFPAMERTVKIYSLCVASKLQELGSASGEVTALAEAIIPLCTIQYRNIVFSYVNEIKPEIQKPVARQMMADERSFAIRTILRLRKPSSPSGE